MSRKRRRTPRPYRLRARTVRRDPIDYDALARAALEQAAMNQLPDQHGDTDAPPTEAIHQRHQRISTQAKEPRHDRLA